MPRDKPLLCIAVHDVAPSTWPLVERILAMLDTLGAAPLTLLVVPNYHRRGSISDDRVFVRAIERRKEGGDEVALHGFVHLDEAAPPRTPLDYLARRVLTRGEGEFAAVDSSEASRRIEAALAIWRQLEWAIGGFVPPAWLLSAGSRRALSAYGFTYATTHRGLYRLPDWRLAPSRVLSYSSQNAVRRMLSRVVVGAQAATASRAPLRLALHPADALHESVLTHWRATIAPLLATRSVRTKSAWLRQLTEPMQGTVGCAPTRGR